MSEGDKMALDPHFFVRVQGRDFVLFAGLLDAATRAGLRSVVTTPVQIPTADNGHFAVMKARIEFEDGRSYEAIGDASRESCARMIHPHLLRMAETRAVGRAFRWALNIAVTMREELGDGEELPDEERQAAPLGANGSARRPAVVPDQPAEPAPLSPGADIAIKHGPVCISCEVPLTANVYRAAMKHLHQPMCETCGKQELRRQADERLAAEAAAAS